jgi:hypothetical protein
MAVRMQKRYPKGGKSIKMKSSVRLEVRGQTITGGGAIDKAAARYIARRILHDNPKELYGL